MTHHLALVPRDAFFCKDGRGWFTSETGRGHALEWPYPSTIRGALRAAWGRRRERHLGRALTRDEWRDLTAPVTLGRTFALRRGWSNGQLQWERIWPFPADALVTETDAVVRLDPRPPRVETLGRADPDDPAGARERLWTARTDRNKPGERPQWWSERRILPWLIGQPDPDEPPPRLSRRLQTHVTIGSATHTAVDEQLFSHELVETIDRRHEWAIGCEASLPSNELAAIATLGSDSRLAAIERVPSALFDLPTELARAFERRPCGLRLVVVTPCAFARGWLPDGLALDHERLEYRGHLPGVDAELVLRAALVDRSLGISGWDMAANTPRATTRAVAPGAVYFFVRADGRPFTPADAGALWSAAVGDRTDEGFGRVIPGLWDPTS